MINLVLAREEEQAVKTTLLKFVYKVGNIEESRRPEDIAILPAMTKILLGQHD